MERLQPGVAFGNNQIDLANPCSQMPDELFVQVRHVTGNGEDKPVTALVKAGVKAGQCTHAGEPVRDLPAGEKRVTVRTVRNNENFVEQSGQGAMYHLDETPLPAGEKSFVAPHSA